MTSAAGPPQGASCAPSGGSEAAESAASAGVHIEVNFDGIPGPTHNYAGLARGNLAAERNKSMTSSPREAALQGLAKMRAMAQRGLAQAVLPPHERPAMSTLRAMGFAGTDAQVLATAARDAPSLLAACSSAAAMWVANAATVSASSGTRDGRVHFTPANLATHLHRAIEAATTTAILRAIFADASRFVVHDPLPSSPQTGDEGAANHTGFAGGVELFVYGRRAYGGGPSPSRFPARQAREASEAIARSHGLAAHRTVFAQQTPRAIDAGVFHNDVIAVGHDTTLFCHERAWIDQNAVLADLARGVGAGFVPIVVPEADVPLDDAVSTYLFNSQLVTRRDGGSLLVAPAECRENARVAAYLDNLLASDGPIKEVVTFDLRQSMRNGGGPACLRLRVPLTTTQRGAIASNVFLDDALADALEAWIRKHYRDRLAPTDLSDPKLLDESRRGLDELTKLLRIGSVYAFQR